MLAAGLLIAVLAIICWEEPMFLDAAVDAYDNQLGSSRRAARLLTIKVLI